MKMCRILIFVSFVRNYRPQCTFSAFEFPLFDFCAILVEKHGVEFVEILSTDDIAYGFVVFINGDKAVFGLFFYIIVAIDSERKIDAAL